ncbi:MAG: hypothetical protein A3G20_09230 [Acidobacteria bacterium RIFCSPLOWO2_12_FULL_59_11]|nr:MAG: hypothetical protein A3G20_09230 [Acidobacteria bacterium RIFCSPLOWO2_12_FULL_59_11]
MQKIADPYGSANQWPVQGNARAGKPLGAKLPLRNKMGWELPPSFPDFPGFWPERRSSFDGM